MYESRFDIMNDSYFNNEIILSFVNSIFKMQEDLKTIPIPELYGIGLDTFQNNKFYNIRGFNGMNGFQLITPKQTIMIGGPVHLNMLHYYLYEIVCKQIYSGQKLEAINHILGRNDNCNITSLNHISLRYVNDVSDKNGEINVSNFCIIYGNLNNINSYQKKILLESVNSIKKKDSNIPIYCYDSLMEISITDIMSITPHNNIALDNDEKLLSSEDFEYTFNISNYSCVDKSDYFYQYDDKTNTITPIAQFNIPNYEKLTEYGIKILDPYSLNKLLVNKTSIMSPGIYSDPNLIFPELSKETKHSK